MQQLGERVLPGGGFSRQDLQAAQKIFRRDGYNCTLVKLDQVLEENCAEASLLIVRDGANAFGDADELYDEQAEQEYDSKAFMYGRVVNKHARHNICFADFSQEPDYKNREGRIVAFDDVPLLQAIQQHLPDYFGEKATNLNIEGNFYYDIDKCGIGFHGDTERRKIIAIRLGNTIPLHYQWFKEGKPVGKRVIFSLDHGDLYMMSEKTTGCDWRKKNIYTLRHAAGCEKYTTFKIKK